MRSPRSASAMISARSWSGGTSSASTSSSAWASTSGCPPECATSPGNLPRPWLTIGTTWPSPSRWLNVTLPFSRTNMPGAGSPAPTAARRAISRTLPNRLMRAISASVSTGNI